MHGKLFKIILLSFRIYLKLTPRSFLFNSQIIQRIIPFFSRFPSNSNFTKLVAVVIIDNYVTMAMSIEDNNQFLDLCRLKVETQRHTYHFELQKPCSRFVCAFYRNSSAIGGYQRPFDLKTRHGLTHHSMLYVRLFATNYDQEALAAKTVWS